MISVGKALGSGVPIGAALVIEAVASQVFAGDHGSTYGGNLLSSRAGLVVLEQLTGSTEARPYEPPAGLIGHVREIAPVFEQALDRLAARHDVVALTRGVGVMRALELRVDAAPIVDAARAAGLLVNRTAERVVRMLPPLTVTRDEIDEAVEHPRHRSCGRCAGSDDVNTQLATPRPKVTRAAERRTRKRRQVKRLSFRDATGADAPQLFALIEAHTAEGHLLPRRLDELAANAARFVIAEHGGDDHRLCRACRR